jgi:hypothetical protein
VNFIPDNQLLLVLLLICDYKEGSMYHDITSNIISDYKFHSNLVIAK